MNIQLLDVSKIIKGVDILSDVNAEFASGTVTGLHGVNGSGKTMILRLLAGLIKPTKGQVLIDGKELWKELSFPESMGALIENPAFIDYYSGLENLKVLASIRNRITEAEIKDAIHTVGLDPNSKKKYRKYSLGMKQRLGIACAVMEKPQVILLDEPTNALDTDGIQMVKRVVLREKARGAVVVMACHDAEVLRELSDVIYHINEGRISESVMPEGIRS